MKNYGVFDILGPVMIGPSSSHTAGAARLAKMASTISGEGIEKVEFILHGSFAKTYKGHGTDRALVGGILGMDPWDIRIRNSFSHAENQKLEYSFIEGDLGDVHPNTIKFRIFKESGRIVEISGSSIGGGSIRIYEVDGQPVELNGEYPTLIISYKDQPGMLSKISTVLYESEINIAFLKVFRNIRGEKAVMVCETDSGCGRSIRQRIRELGDIYSVKEIRPLKEGEENVC